MLGSIKDLQVSMPPEILISQANIGKAGFMEDKRRAAPDFLTNFDAEFPLNVFAGLLRDNCLWEYEPYLRDFIQKYILHGLALCVCVSFILLVVH